MIKWLILFIPIFVSCTNESIGSKISDADKIVVIDNATKFSLEEIKPQVVQGFKALLQQTPVVTECEPQGTILFKKGDELLLEAGYYKDASTCNFVIVKKGDKKEGYPLSYNTLVYLGMYFQEMKKKNERNN